MSADKRSQSGGRKEAFRAALYVSRQRVEPQVTVRTKEKLRLKAAVRRDAFWFHTEKFSFPTTRTRSMTKLQALTLSCEDQTSIILHSFDIRPGKMTYIHTHFHQRGRNLPN